MIAAVNGICAGGGLHFVADADIVIASSNATFVDPHVSVGQVSAFETIALARKSPMEPITRMALIGRHERVSAERAVRARHHQRGRRPTRAPAGRRPRAGREDRPELAGGDGRDQARAVGRARDRPHRRLPSRERPSSSACGATPTKRRARWPSPSGATPSGRRSEMSYETLKVERHGPVGWLIFNRPEQLNAMNNAMRDELADAWKELDARPRGPCDRAHGEGRAFQTGVDVTEIASDGVGMERYRTVGRGLGPPLHRLAPAGVEAGHHRGQRHLRRRRVPLGGRRRHRHRGVGRPVLRSARVASVRSCRSRPSD